MPNAIRRIAPAAPAAMTRVMLSTGWSPSRLVAEAEQARRQVNALDLELLDELGPDAGRLEAALGLAFHDARLLEHEHVLHDDDVALHTLDLRDVHDPARPVLEAGLLDDDVHGGGDLLPDGADREVDAGHEHHRLEAGGHVAGAVGVAGGHRAVVARVHGLEHVERLARAALPDDDAIGPHAQRVADELPDRDRALALDVRRSRLERHHVLLPQLELGGVLDRHDPLVVGDERRQHVERRRLARAGAAGDEDVEPRLHAGAQELEHDRGRGAESDQVVHREGGGGELPDRDDGTDEGQRGNDGVDAGAVGEASVDHRARLVDAASDRGDDPIDDPHHVVVVLEDDVRQLEAAGPLDVDLPRAVDHHLGDGLVAQERLQRTEADDLVRDLLEHADALGAREGEALLVDDLAEDLLDLAAHLDLVGQVELRVEVLDDPGLDPELDVAERLADRRGRAEPLARRLCGRRRAGTAGSGRGKVGTLRRGARSGALDPLQQGHDSKPLRPHRPWNTLPRHRHANSDFFWAAFLVSAPASAGLVPTTAEASRRMSCDTCASRLLRKNGTPRLRAYTTLRPSETIVWSTRRPIECSTSATRMPRDESARLSTRRTLSDS